MTRVDTGTILIIDDNDDVRRLVGKILKAAGHDVVEGASGEEALTITETTTPDLVLMDVRLPGGFDGLETTRIIKGDPRMREVPVIALTASVLEKDRQRALAAGCNGFIGKPIDIKNLTSLVEEYLAVRS